LDLLDGKKAPGIEAEQEEIQKGEVMKYG
jgi:hypothetical protein